MKPMKYQKALDLFTESVYKPDHDLRSLAHNEGVMMNLWRSDNTL
ncbi:MAG: hypothetical protein CM15mV15_0110 [uncultured marine virus]|nr:MAG: hypothetical protein CM15mV15_0110 [uncultured marine virus]